MSTANIFQVALEIWGGIFCMLITILSRWDAAKSSYMTRRLWHFPVVASLLIFADAGTYIFRFHGGSWRINALRFCFFLMYALQQYLMLRYAMEINRLVYRSEKIVWDGFLKFHCVVIGLTLLSLVINLAIPIYYRVDEHGHFIKSRGANISIHMLFLCIAVLVVQISKNKRVFTERILLTLRLSGVLFLIAIVLQFFVQGIGILNVVITADFLLLFLEFWVDEKEHGIEKKMIEFEQSEQVKQEMMQMWERE